MKTLLKAMNKWNKMEKAIVYTQSIWTPKLVVIHLYFEDVGDVVLVLALDDVLS